MARVLCTVARSRPCAPGEHSRPLEDFGLAADAAVVEEGTATDGVVAVEETAVDVAEVLEASRIVAGTVENSADTRCERRAQAEEEDAVL